VAPTPLLFLIADTGGGHRACATAVAEQLGPESGFDCHIVDPFAESSPRLIGWTADLYGPLIRDAPWLWGAMYHATNSRPGVATLVHSTLRPVQPGITRLIERLQPAAIVSFHPLLNHIASRARRSLGLQRPLLTVVTDLVEMHASWFCPEVDTFVVPTRGALDCAVRAGVPAERCRELGLPVSSAFAGGADGDGKRAARLRVGLPAQGFVVLLCGGADGSGGIAARARALATLDVHVVVICGRNRQLLAELEKVRPSGGGSFGAHGFVTNMAEWMRAADVIATRAGPTIVAEALCAGTPLLLTSYLAQERGNVDWVLEVGAGRFVRSVDELVAAVRSLSSPAGSAELVSFRAAARQAARPEAARAVAALIAEHARATG
jgi:1,2-diacylglycerol 3-beta-galactosyltransferase